MTYDEAFSQVRSEGLDGIASKYLLEENPDMNGWEHRDEYYMELDDAHAAVYPIKLPENTTLCGVPEIHVRLSNENYDYSGLMVSAVLIDLADPGKGYDISEYTGPGERTPGQFYDYTFYMIPTVYTVQPGHHLYLYLTTWDPYRAYLDRDFVSLSLEKDTDGDDIDYSFTVDNGAIRVMMPVKQ